MRISIPLTAFVLGLLHGGQAVAQTGTAADWYADCAAYIGILQGTSDGDDLEVTYCMGQTLGIVAGLETGSRIGALSMASILSGLLGLDPEKVFEVFSTVEDESLLGYCVPENATGSFYITAVSDYLAANPGKSSLPATAVFFEALQEQHPCEAPAAPGDEVADAPDESDQGAPGN